MLERENAFYQAHKAEFHEKYLDKWLVIAGEELWGVFDKVSDAAKAALEHFETEEFFLHRPADDDMVIGVIPTISISRPGEDQEEPASVTSFTDGEPVKFQYAY
jgi:hypothetical protein